MYKKKKPQKLNTVHSRASKYDQLSLQRLLHQAQHDSLTDIYNHAYGKELIGNMLQAKTPFETCALLVIDLDYFKQINDNYGHLFGDEVLIRATKIFLKTFPEDSVLVRAGGDEFVAFVKNLNHLETVQIINCLLQRIHTIIMPSKKDHLTCSIGICSLPEDALGYTYEQVLNNADWALYHAKLNGRDTYAFCDNMNRYKEGMEQRTQKMQDIDSRYLKNDIVSTAFEVLEKAKSFDDGINLLLKIIGVRFQLDRVNIIDLNLKSQLISRKYYWTRDAVPHGFDHPYEYNKDNFRTLFQNIDEDGTLSLDMDSVKKLSPTLYRYVRENDAKNLLVVPMFHKGSLIGAMAYTVCNGARCWLPKIKLQLVELSKIITAHYAQSRAMNAKQNNFFGSNDLDGLTGLLPFSYFREKMERLIIAGKANDYATIYTDFEGFKLINQKYGYSFGDKLLKLFTTSVSQALSDKPNMFFSRVVADQFVLFRPYEDFAIAEQRVDSINQIFIKQVKKLYPYLNIRLRSGIYHITNECHSASEAIDAANYARRELTNYTNTTALLYNDELAAKQSLEQEIYANSNNSFDEKQFKVYLQPKFSLNDFMLIGAEALVRWFKEDGSQIYPDKFIPILEANGRIIELDFFVFEKVVQFLAKNKELGRKQVPISVNASILHTKTAHTVERYLEILQRYDVDPSLLEIELTETAAAHNYDMVCELFTKLRQAGFKTSLDDFGAGYSLINTIVDIPMDTLKIDRSLLLNCETTIKGHIFLKQIIAMLHSLGYHTICEGVETEQQRQLLLDAGCSKAQGYIFSKPLPIEDYESRFYPQKQ